MKYPDKESSTVEFKREIPKNEQIIKTIIGFCNQKGGKLLLGIEDNGTVIGIDEDLAHNLMEYLEKAIQLTKSEFDLLIFGIKKPLNFNLKIKNILFLE